jgi:hypothetical protein
MSKIQARKLESRISKIQALHSKIEELSRECNDIIVEATGDDEFKVEFFTGDGWHISSNYFGEAAIDRTVFIEHIRDDLPLNEDTLKTF